MNRKIDKNRIWHAVKRTSIALIGLFIIIFLIKIAPNYVRDDKANINKLIINNNNVSNNVKKGIIMENGTVYLSIEDVKNFFDEYVTVENGKIITTSNTNTVAIPIDGNEIYDNGSYKTIEHKILQKNNTYYLPMSDLSDIYNYEINYNKDNRTVVVDSLTRRLVQAEVAKSTNVKYKSTILSRDVTKVQKGAIVSIIQDNKTDIESSGWIKIRTTNGEVGYIKKNNLINENTIRGDLKEPRIDGKVSLVWDYYEKEERAPVHTDKIVGINVVSPSFYELNEKSELNVNIEKEGKDYISWARNNDYEIWPTLSNTSFNDINAISKMISTFENRSRLIDSIINELIKDDVDGVNVDFENIYKEDKDKYSRFIIELKPRLHEIGKKLSVAVTAPDGADTWSLCYDRNVIGDVADYIVFMGYEETAPSSTVGGTTCGADWLELNIKKFTGQEEVENSKIIVALPLYTRLWKTENNVTTSQVVNMNNIVIPENVTKKWDDSLKQNYIEYNVDGIGYKMWIEDVDSLKAKLQIITKYELAGAGFWELGRENQSIWEIVNGLLNINIEE